ncbi:MAG: hypothetical protein ACRD0U_01570 [Acidimicrobiales bacterium]
MAAIGFAAVLAACGDDGDDASTTTTESSTTTTDSTTTSTTEPTTTTVLTQEEIVRREAVRLIELRNDVYEHPDPNRVTEYVITLCECYPVESQGVTNMVNEGVHFAGPAFEVMGARTVSVEGTGADVDLVLRQPDTPQVDAAGNVVIEGSFMDRIPVHLSLTRTAPGSDTWIITGWFFRDDYSEETIDEIIEAGVPQ